MMVEWQEIADSINLIDVTFVRSCLQNKIPTKIYTHRVHKDIQ